MDTLENVLSPAVLNAFQVHEAAERVVFGDLLERDGDID